MRSLSEIIKSTTSDVTANIIPGEALRGIFVPINTSAGAFNALEYALQLAKVLHTSIHLFHITDAQELPESGNPIVIGRMLDRLDRKATNCVDSLKEMIEENGVDVHTAESKVGNVSMLLSQRMTFLAPTLIVVGRDSFSRDTIRGLISEATCPLIVVPETCPPRLPDSVGLASVSRIDSNKNLQILHKLIQSTAHQLTILSPAKWKSNSARIQQLFASLDSERHLVNSTIQQIESLNTTVLENFILRHEVDLLCIARRKRSFWLSLFTRDAAADIAFQLAIPTLIL